MNRNTKRILQSMTGAAMAFALIAGAQSPAPPAPAGQPPASSAPSEAPAAPASSTWSVGPMNLSGLIDGYYSYNANRPSNAINGQINQLYNFNDKTDQFNLSEARLTLNHDPNPVGARIDFIFGRADELMNGDASAGNGKYIEQAYLSFKPAKAKGLEMDFGKFVTSAGAEVIEAKDDWNYSRSLLFVNAIPYFHFGLRASMPVSKVETVGLQVVNGWNNISNNNGGATIGLTSALAEPKYSWYLNYYTGPANTDTQKGYRNLIDTTLLLTPTSKFNAYLNYDYGQTRDAITGTGASATGDNDLHRWQGAALAVHEQVTGTSALAGRFEYFTDPTGSQTGVSQDLKEFTGTYEYKWTDGLLSRIEYRRDWSTANYFDKGNTPAAVRAQSTITVAFIAFFGPKH